MPKIDLGEKQMCPSCGAKFYDLGKRPAKCPKCGNTFDPFDEELLASRQAQRMSALDIEETPMEDEDDDQAIKVKAIDPDAEEEEEVDSEEVTKELDIENIDEPELIMGDELDDEGDIPGVGGGGDTIPEGFSEQELDEDEAIVEEEVPFLEGDDELFEEELASLDIDEDDPDLK